MVSLADIESAWDHKTAMTILRHRPKASHDNYDPMCNPRKAMAALCKRFGVARLEDISVAVNYTESTMNEPSGSSRPMFVRNQNSSDEVDITAEFKANDFDNLHLLPVGHPALQICKKFVSEAYHFNYNAMENGYQPVYVLCLFADNLKSHNNQNVDWCMTVFKLPEGLGTAYGCECVRFADLWARHRTIVIDCYDRKEAGLFHFTIPVSALDDEENVTDSSYEGDVEKDSDDEEEEPFETDETAEDTDTSNAMDSDATPVNSDVEMTEM